MIRITIHLPGGTEQVLEFTKNSIMLGRAAANDVCIDQGGVSRYHATITLEGDTLVVQDLGSTNGTLLSGKKIQTSNINSGDRLVLGDVAITVDNVSETPLPESGAPEALFDEALPDVTGTLAPGTSGQGFGNPPQNEAIRPPSGNVKRPTQSNIERPPSIPSTQKPEKKDEPLKALEALAIESSGTHKAVPQTPSGSFEAVPASENAAEKAPDKPSEKPSPVEKGEEKAAAGKDFPVRPSTPISTPNPGFTEAAFSPTPLMPPLAPPLTAAPTPQPIAPTPPPVAGPSGLSALSASASPASSAQAAAAAEVPPMPPAKAAEPEKQSRDQSNNAFFWQALQSFLAPVWHYIVDDSVSEIMINGPAEIYVEKKGKLIRVPEAFTPEQIQAAVLNIAQFVGRRVSEEEPYLDARLPDGSRVAVLLPPCSRKGASMAIRKFSKEKLTLDRLISFGSLSPEMVTYLTSAVMLKRNIIISGGTSSGKTSLLNVVSGLIPDDERIITIEDAAELQLRQDHVLPMETKPADKKGRGQVTIRDLVKASLRMRPDRIVVGEIRGGEALDLLQAMNTGHSGSMATVHASSPYQALTRLETLSLFSGIEIPLRALREQVATAIEVVIQASRLPDHSRKVTHISEVCKLTETGDYSVKDIFRFARESSENGKIIGRHLWTGQKSNMISEMELCGMTEALAIFQGAPPPEGVQFQAAGH